MASFFGRYAHSLDTKGRIILPSKFRPAFAGGGFLSQYNERCLALWTPDTFEVRMNEMQQRQEESAEQRNLARLWAMGTQDVEIDRQGRMVIPPFLREYARLNDEVLVHGALDRVELWNPEEWAAKVAPAETTLVAEDAPVLKGSYSTKKPNLTTGSDSTRGSGSTTKRSDATTGIDATKKADATKKGGS